MPLHELPWVDIHSKEDFKNYKEYFQGLGNKTAQFLENANSSSLNSFLIGAQQAFRQYHVATRAHKHTQTTTFTFSETKDDEDQIVTIFIIVDSSRMESQEDVIAQVQKSMYQELKRHPNEHVPVTIISDETSNFKINGLLKDISWTRGQAISHMFVLQNAMAFEKTYGEKAFDILENESEIMVWLPGQRSQPMLERLSKALGFESIMLKSESGSVNTDDFYTSNYSYAEDGKPLLDADLIRRGGKGIVRIRNSRDLLVDVPPYAAIEDVREVASINPRFKKEYKLPISAWLNGNRPETFKTRWKAFKLKFKHKNDTLLNKKIRFERYTALCRWLSWLLHNWWVGPVIYLVFFTDFLLRLWYSLNGGA